MQEIPFNKPYMTGQEIACIQEAHQNLRLSGDGPFTKKCHRALEDTVGSPRALLTHSCTAALEMMALLLDIEPGDEVIMPSYTFVSTANAFVLRGATVVFVDIRADTLNIDEKLLEEAITPRTRAIVVVHYAGVSCEMDAILETGKRHGLPVLEDAAQGIMASYKGMPLGSMGALGALSFHETKNIISGEGGALLVNDSSYTERAEIIREKGTDRSRFLRGHIDKYTWQEVGSSFLPGEIVAAFLWAQLQKRREITESRLQVWNLYQQRLQDLESSGCLRLPTIPSQCEHNAHMFYFLANSSSERELLIDGLNKQGIGAVFHYVPLHDSPAGRSFGRVSGELSVTHDLASRIIRLPLWVGMSEEQVSYVCDHLSALLEAA